MLKNTYGEKFLTIEISWNAATQKSDIYIDNNFNVFKQIRTLVITWLWLNSDSSNFVAVTTPTMKLVP